MSHGNGKRSNDHSSASRIKNRVVDTFGKSLSEMRNNSVPIFDSFRTPELNTFRSLQQTHEIRFFNLQTNQVPRLESHTVLTFSVE